VENTDQARFCGKCGNALNVLKPAVEYKPPVVLESPQVDLGRLRRTKLNSKWSTINSWSSLIAGAQGKEAIVMSNIKKALEEIAAPNLNIEHRKVSLSGLTSMFSEARKQLVIDNKKLRGYYFFVSIADYGKQLNVSWYLMQKSNWLTRLLKMSTIPFAGFLLAPVIFAAKIFYHSTSSTIPELMNMFDLEEFSAYTSTVHHAVTGAVQGLMSQMNMDFSKVDTKSRGFLNVS
jgi:hypothetical protein